MNIPLGNGLESYFNLKINNMADTVSGKKKVYFTRSTGKVYTKDLREPNMGVPPGRFNKKVRGTKAKKATNLPDVNW